MIEDMIPLAECIIEEILKEESFFKNITVWEKRDFDSNTIYIEVRDRCFVYANPHKANFEPERLNLLLA